MELNYINYYTLENQYITNSKITAFLKDKRYFCDLFVSGAIEKNVTDAMIIGSAVDCLVTQSQDEFDKRYRVVGRRDSKAPDYECQLNQTMYDSVLKMANKIKDSSAYKELEGFDRQAILKIDMKLGQFPGIAGMIDMYHIDHELKKVIIVDLKTSNDVSLKHYYWKCLDMGYFRQLAMYEILIKGNFPETKDYEFEHRHLVLEKDSDDINQVYPFIIDPLIVRGEIMNINDVILPILMVEADFKSPDYSWKDAKTVTNIKDYA